MADSNGIRNRNTEIVTVPLGQEVQEGVQSLPISLLRLDGGTQSRETLLDEAVYEYTELWEQGVQLPPVDAVWDGKFFWVIDGFARIRSALKANIENILTNVRFGTQREAVLWSLKSNSSHGFRRTNQEKRRSIKRALDDEEWCKFTDKHIADACAVSESLVRLMRNKFGYAGDRTKPQERIRQNGETVVIPAIKPIEEREDPQNVLFDLKATPVLIPGKTSNSARYMFIQKNFKDKKKKYRENQKTPLGDIPLVCDQDEEMFWVESTYNLSLYLECVARMMGLREHYKSHYTIVMVGGIFHDTKQWAKTFETGRYNVKTLNFKG